MDFSLEHVSMQIYLHTHTHTRVQAHKEHLLY